MERDITSVDLNREFQETGIKRNREDQFLNHEMNENSFQNEAIQRLSTASLCLAFHLGALADHLIKTSASSTLKAFQFWVLLP